MNPPTPSSPQPPPGSSEARDELRAAVFASLRTVAPEVDVEAVDPGRPLRDEVDIDSFDFLNLLIDLHERTGIEVPETDYARLGTLDALLAYLREKRLERQ